MSSLEELKQTLKAQTEELRKIEAEIANLTTMLNTTPAGVSGPLIDAEGFPRNDCDLWEVRTWRNRRICLTTDHKTLSKEIEANLHRLHELARETGVAQEEVQKHTELQASRTPEQRLLDRCKEMRPFFRVNSVSGGSPADQAGLREGDQIVYFHEVTHANGADCGKLLGAAVQNNVRNKIAVVVRRGDGLVALGLTPQPWHGQGLLGCHILPC